VITGLPAAQPISKHIAPKTLTEPYYNNTGYNPSLENTINPAVNLMNETVIFWVLVTTEGGG
jgi:hypothetical protein